MMDAEPTMTAADILAKIGRLDDERAEWMEQLRAALPGNIAAVPDAPPVAPAQLVEQIPKDLIKAGAAAAIARRSKQTMTAWCRRHAFNGVDGFAVKLGARWHVSKSRLLKYLSTGQAI